MRAHDGVIRAGLLGAVVLASAGCGSDSGGSADPKQVAIQELGQLGYILHVGGPLFGNAATPFDPGAPPPETCEQGVGIVTDGEGRRTFDFYDTAPIVSFSRYEFENCRVGGSIGSMPAQLEYDGEVETGAERDHDPSNLADSYDRYVEFGGGDEALVQERIVRDVEGLDVVEEATDRITGTVEWRNFDSGSDHASVLVRLLERVEPSEYSLVWLQGEADDPLRVTAGPEGDTYDIDGPYTYNSSRCTGGARRITTTQALVRGEGIPIGGEIGIALGTTVLSIAFTQDGATARLGDGEPVTLTTEEVRLALDEPAC